MDLTLLDLLAFLRPSMNTTTGASPYLNSTFACMLDQTVAPMDLGLCGNASLFTTFRPKARFIAPGPSFLSFLPVDLLPRADLSSCTICRGMDER